MFSFDFDTEDEIDMWFFRFLPIIGISILYKNKSLCLNG